MSREQQIQAVLPFIDQAQARHMREHPGSDFFVLSDEEKMVLVRDELDGQRELHRLGSIADHDRFERVSY